MPKAVLFAAGSDTAGTLIRSQRAFAAARRHSHSTWEVRSVVTTRNYIDYAEDIEFSPIRFAALYDFADVVVLNSTLYAHHVYDDRQGKPTVLVHHGLHEHHFSQTLTEVIKEGIEIQAVQIGTTVNLELLGPITWVPTPYDLGLLKNLREKLFRHSEIGDIRVLHAPTDRAIKSTADLIAAVNILNMEGHHIELEIIEGVTNEEVIRAKAERADIYVDQLHLGYGCNAIEAWALDIPVIAGYTGHPDWRAHAVKRYECHTSSTGLPFVEASPETLVTVLRYLATDHRARAQWAEVGRSHVRRFHSPETHVRTMEAVLLRALGKPTIPGPVRGSLRHLESKFRQRRQRAAQANQANQATQAR